MDIVRHSAVDLRICSPQDRSFGEVKFAGIAIRSIDDQQRHMGVLHRDLARDAVSLLHLAWHCDLRNNLPSNEYLWIDPAVHPRRLRQVAAVCRRVWQSNQGTLPYAFSSPNDCFDVESGEYLLGPTRHGLTCASFVLAVFQAAGIKLLEYDRWPAGRPGDREWQQKIVEGLSNRAPIDHLRAVEAEIGTVRFRPEEVAGAAAVSPLPATFERAIGASKLVLRRLAANH